MIRNWLTGLKIALATACLYACATVNAHADTWVKAESNHFTVYSNASAAVARGYVQRLEAYYYTLYELYKVKNADADVVRPRFTTFLLRDRRDMRAVWPDIDDTIAGFYEQCEDGAVAYATYEVSVAGGNTHLQRGKTGFEDYVLFHEYAHHFMFENYNVPLPAWYVEGFAEYFMTMEIDGKNVAIGQASDQRYTSLFSNSWLDYAGLLRGVRPNTSAGNLQFYAQSWLLTHYIMASPERIKMFSAYIDDVNAGGDAVTAFESRFNIKVADLHGILHDYLSKGVPVVSFAFNAMPVTSIDVTSMPKSADRLLMWRSALQTCNAAKLGADFPSSIDAEAKKYPDDVFAQLVDARAQIVLNEAPDKSVEPALTAIVTADPQNVEAQYLLGRYYLDRAEAPNATDATADMARARKAFLAAYKLDPMSAPVLYHLALAQADLKNFPTETALNAAVEASNLAPSVEAYAFLASQILIAKNRPADALILLMPIASNPHNPASAKVARLIIDAIKAGHSPEDIQQLLSDKTEE